MTEFIYNGTKYSTWNLRKELIKMGISKKDIEILPEVKNSVQKEEPRVGKYIYYWHPHTHEIYGGYTSDINRIPLEGDAYIKKLYEIGHIWDPDKKTGIGAYFTEKYARELICIKGKIKFPVELDNNGLPIIYN